MRTKIRELLLAKDHAAIVGKTFAAHHSGKKRSSCFVASSNRLPGMETFKTQGFQKFIARAAEVCHGGPLFL